MSICAACRRDDHENCVDNEIIANSSWNGADISEAPAFVCYCLAPHPVPTPSAVLPDDWDQEPPSDLEDAYPAPGKVGALRVCAHEVPVGRTTLTVHKPGRLLSATKTRPRTPATANPVTVHVEERDDEPGVEITVDVVRDGGDVDPSGWWIGSLSGRPALHVYGIEQDQPF